MSFNNLNSTRRMEFVETQLDMAPQASNNLKIIKKKTGEKMNQEGTRDFVMCKFTNCTTLSSEWILISSSENRQLFFEQRRLTTETKRPRD